MKPAPERRPVAFTDSEDGAPPIRGRRVWKERRLSYGIAHPAMSDLYMYARISVDLYPPREEGIDGEPQENSRGR